MRKKYVLVLCIMLLGIAVKNVSLLNAVPIHEIEVAIDPNYIPPNQ